MTPLTCLAGRAGCGVGCCCHPQEARLPMPPSQDPPEGERGQKLQSFLRPSPGGLPTSCPPHSVDQVPHKAAQIQGKQRNRYPVLKGRPSLTAKEHGRNCCEWLWEKIHNLRWYMIQGLKIIFTKYLPPI